MFGNFMSNNAAVQAFNNFTRGAEDATAHVLICALDYKGTSCELTCTMDGNNMQKLCRECGIQDVEVMYDNECTKENFAAKVREVGQRCSDDDYFVFYYSGHGSSLPDLDGDEVDGKDEALCFVGPNGELSASTFMSDDDFAETVTGAIPEGCRILIMCDCCHSGTIGDFKDECWNGREAISMSGCKDSQTSGDMGKGGIFTHSMLLALEKIQNSDKDDDEMSVGAIYNATLLEDDRVFASEQDIQIRCTPGLKPDGMAWPLVPKGHYRSPLSQAAGHCAQQVGVNAEDSDDDDDVNEQVHNSMASQEQELAQMFGVDPNVIQSLLGNQNGFKLNKINGHHSSNEDYMQSLQGMSGMCGAGLSGKGKKGGCAVM
eukprot:TRINITY_DN5752_c0_g1_i1.p1 TRINITY_DN5752_c0_g1~~TRINITY_DN5752_c0_g1_i1.p1  ORF type:complete len:374 (-),score=110.67 TRINITY_DN5752_c0_g1_i1:152-1273(-)